MKLLRYLCAAAWLAMTAYPAQAAKYVFSYQFESGSIIDGVLLGSAQTDPNIIAVDAVVGIPTIDGTPFPSAAILSGYRSYAYGGLFSSAFVSFDGNFVDLFIVNASVDQGFGIKSEIPERDTGDVTAVLGRVPYYDSYNPQRWTLSAAVPEPASWLLMIGGFGLIGTTMRQRACST